MNYEGRRWVTMKQAADFLGVHVQTAYQLFYRGELPGVRVGRTVRINFKRLNEQLTEQLEAQKRGADRARR